MRYRSKYVQLFERLKREILRGAYQRGQRLPGENEMAQEYGMSRQTVRQALSLLEQEDLIERRAAAPMCAAASPGASALGTWG